MLRIQQLKLPVGHSSDDLAHKISDALHLPAGKFSYEIVKRSLDARKKPALFYIYAVDVSCQNEKKAMRSAGKKYSVLQIQQKTYAFPAVTYPTERPYRPVIIGAGPAGLFCALMLARSGYRPVIIERGQAVEQRQADVQAFWQTGILNTNSNVQFGEGGAGTFSDGKLNTAIKDPSGKIRFVLETFVEAGADPSILYDYKPHVGTDVLTDIVSHIREEILRLGGTYLFGTTLTDMEQLSGPGSKAETGSAAPAKSALYRLHLSGSDMSVLETDTVVLAIGHSARDTFEMLLQKGLLLTPKAFAVGLRIQHPQKAVNDALYGTDWEKLKMPPASYKLTHRLEDGRGVYSFCMCPGGYVVNASSEAGRLAVNGMSYHARNSENANSAIVVTVNPSDFPDTSPLGGVHFQRTLEKRAFEAGQGNIPVQRLEDFAADRPTEGPGSIRPMIRGQYTYANVRHILPESLSEDLLTGVRAFERQIPGFSDPDALFCGVESRTSSPVRIERTKSGEAVGFPGIYPCGEGAGYAGGITSAAVDGIRIAEAVLQNENVDFPYE